MNLQEKMYLEVENWVASGELKHVYLNGKDYSEAKFNYWLSKWKSQQTVVDFNGFKEVGLPEIASGKVLEIESPTGVRITVFI